MKAAKWKRNLELAELFIEKGANPWLRDSDAETIIETAEKYDSRAAEFITTLHTKHTQENDLLSTPTLALRLPKRKSSVSLAEDSISTKRHRMEDMKEPLAAGGYAATSDS